MLDFIPVGDRVIVKTKDESEEVTNSFGMIVTVKDNVNKELPQCGEVMAVGKGGTFPECPNPSEFFKKGDIVYFNRYAGEEVIFENFIEVEQEVEQFEERPTGDFEVVKRNEVNGKIIDEMSLPVTETVSIGKKKVMSKKRVAEKFTILRLDAIFGKLKNAK